MKRFVNQKVRRWLNHCPKTRDGSMPTNYLQRQILFPEANTFSRGKVMVNLSHLKLKRKGHTEEKYVPAAKISRKQIEVISRKNSISKNADAVAVKEINRSWLKVDKSQRIGNGTFGNCYIALYRNESRVVAKEMKIIESPKKKCGEKHRQSLELETTGESLFCLVFA